MPNEDKKVVMMPVEELKTGKFQVMPKRGEKEEKAFFESVKINGVEVPIEIDEDAYVIDGHTRLAAAKAAGHTQVPCIVTPGLSDEQKRRRAYSQSNRRHLTRKQLRDLTRQALSEFHMYSNGYIETMVPVSDRTVSKVRGEMMLAKEIPCHEKLIGLDGNMQEGQKMPKSGRAKGAEKPAGNPVVANGQIEPGDNQLTITSPKLESLKLATKKVRIFRSHATRADIDEALKKGTACLIVPNP